MQINNAARNFVGIKYVMTTLAFLEKCVWFYNDFVC